MFQIPLLPKEVHSLLHRRRHALGDALAVVHHAHIDCRARLGFNKFDVNGDDKISSSELGAIMGSLSQPSKEDELLSMILEVYTDGDGFIDINEVMELNTKGINSADAMQNLKDAFSVYDIDVNGSISAAELFAFTVKQKDHGRTWPATVSAWTEKWPQHQILIGFGLCVGEDMSCRSSSLINTTTPPSSQSLISIWFMTIPIFDSFDPDLISFVIGMDGRKYVYGAAKQNNKEMVELCAFSTFSFLL
ncbi:hypothetical protein ACLB2K_020566 [Fragaria x ananassa]